MIAFVIGTRPEAIKLAPLIKLVPEEQRRVVYTGQHYTRSLAEDVWADVLPYHFDARLETGGKTDAKRLAQMIRRLSVVLPGWDPDWVVVQGDTTSALAGALAAVKSDLKVWHVEAGCRSGDLAQPEEWNRKAIDHLSQGWSYSYGCDGENLCREGIHLGGVNTALHSGDIAIDALLSQSGNFPPICPKSARGQVLVTLHRAELLDNPERLLNICAFLRDLAKTERVTFLMHPHTAEIVSSAVLKGVKVREPLPPREFRSLLSSAKALITDSGGACVEAAYMGIPCVVARQVTEYHSLVTAGLLHLAGDDIAKAYSLATSMKDRFEMSRGAICWDGKAAGRIARRLLG